MHGQARHSWVIMNPGGPPTPDKPDISVVDYEPGDTVSSLMNLRVADIQARYEEWSAKGAEFVTPPPDRGAEIRCYMRDPDGYLIEVGQSTGLLDGRLADKRPQEDSMSQYMLLVYPPVDAPPPGRLERWQAFTDGKIADGVLLGSGRLQDVHAATSVHLRDGETLTSDGPFAETKKYLAGYFLVDCSDLDAALKYAARMPMEDYGTVEVRPLMFPADTPAREMGAHSAA